MDLSLKEFLFTTDNVEATISFWTNIMRMQLLRRVETVARTRIALGYRAEGVGIRFDHDKMLDGPNHKHRSPSLHQFDRRNPSSRVSIVVVVDSLTDIVRRATEQGMGCYIPPTVLSSDTFTSSGGTVAGGKEKSPGGDQKSACLTKVAVLLDPNGIRVRLIESEDVPLESERDAGKLAYLSIPFSDPGKIDKSIAFYEGKLAPSSTSTIPSTSTSVLPSSSSSVPLAAAAAASPWQPPKRVAPGFRVVDSERYTEDLYSCVWLGNASRARTTTLCLVHTIERKISSGFHATTLSSSTSSRSEGGLPRRGSVAGGESAGDSSRPGSIPSTTIMAVSQDPFVGVGFSVLDVGAIALYLGRLNTGVITGHSAVQAQPGLPRFVHFIDPAGVGVEVSDGLMGTSSSSSS